MVSFGASAAIGQGTDNPLRTAAGIAETEARRAGSVSTGVGGPPAGRTAGVMTSSVLSQVLLSLGLIVLLERRRGVRTDIKENSWTSVSR
ncbi:hypothetical protein [Winogradskya humida]|uniref:Uncharacterized protein n=1 Tax=Winogradskya humida TaxID=113566 RepID=A0ABQ3ZFZ7_9ACTN|nr:hypothetical protein [Actinoplanes humidus]GIE17197.1 hypothetical protein Ahu01nite_002990 [Actinoplanes humidus]